MSRQVDIKALVSHIVRGDGGNRCRICMGDTTEGQVFLEDAVMVDGAKSLTLAELLETVTGAQVDVMAELPHGVCAYCATETITAYHFLNLWRQSTHRWQHTLSVLGELPAAARRSKVLYVLINGDNVQTIRDEASVNGDRKKAINRLKRRVQIKTASDARNHKMRNVNHDVNFMKCRCTDCGKPFISPYYLNDHLRRSMKRACVHCSCMMLREELGGHLASIHGVMVHTCYHCFALFDLREDLKRHIQRVHIHGRYRCDACGRTFATSRGLGAHSYSHTLHICSGCANMFTNRKCFVYHKTICSEEQASDYVTYTCDHCGNSYSKKPSLRIHMVQKHLNVLPHSCDTCGKRTSTLAQMREHELTHQMIYSYTCDVCGARMRSRRGHEQHLRLHTGERPYKCSDCGETFISASRRTDHVMRRHRSALDMPHACNLCDARFLRPFKLRKHFETAHSSWPTHRKRRVHAQ